MNNNLEIRHRRSGDSAAIEALYSDAFPDEDLIPLVRSLDGSADIAASMVGVLNSCVVGQAIFTRCHINDESVPVALLGPLAVAKDQQRQGIGSALVTAGLNRMRDMGMGIVFVLGDPGYYSRFGFVKEDSILTPYALKPQWTEAWQSLELRETALPRAGKLSVPHQWSEQSLWM